MLLEEHYAIERGLVFHLCIAWSLVDLWLRRREADSDCLWWVYLCCAAASTRDGVADSWHF